MLEPISYNTDKIQKLFQKYHYQVSVKSTIQGNLKGKLYVDDMERPASGVLLNPEGVFIAACGEQCSRENTAFWVRQRVEKVRKTLAQVGLKPERLQAFVLDTNNGDPAEELDKFAEQIAGLYLASVMVQEVKS